MDPFVEIVIDDQKVETGKWKSSHKTPQWFETKVFNITGKESVIKIKIYDRNFVGNNSLIGECKDILINNELKNNKVIEKTIEIFYQNDTAGILKLSLVFDKVAVLGGGEELIINPLDILEDVKKIKALPTGKLYQINITTIQELTELCEKFHVEPNKFAKPISFLLTEIEEKDSILA